MKILRLAVAIMSFSNFCTAQNQNEANLRILLKDSSTVTKALAGDYNHVAVEIGLNKRYTSLKRKNYPIRIAIDPGHIAANKKEAIIEQRFIKTPKGFFYESELTMATAKLLKKQLEQRGFQVMLTREEGKTALGYSFTYWFKRKFKAKLKEDLLANLITNERYQYLLKADKEIVFQQYFKDLDFIARGAAINAFNADIAIVIHYNATEFKNDPDSYAPSVDYNYSVAFVPGGFTNSELKLENQLDDFIRLASTDILPNSVRLSSYIVDEFKNKLHSEPIMPKNTLDLWYLKKYSTYSGTPGVFGRNLYLTRAVKCPVCYGECFLQNNKKEIDILADRNLKIGKKKITSRVSDVADCYYTGIIKYFDSIGWQSK